MIKTGHTIALTGAPASGKTEMLAWLERFEPLSGFLFFDELARGLIEANPDYRQNWHQLHLDIYHQQVAREEAAAGRSFITDRGTADAFAFHPETAEAVNTTINREYARYTLVIQLGSAAGLGDMYYRTDPIRNEPIPEALRIEAAIRTVWENHPHYHFVPAETDMNLKRKKVVALLARYMDLETIE